jgi:hypothetical protein
MFFFFEAARLVTDRFSVELSQPPPQDDTLDSNGNPTKKSNAQVAYEAAQSFAFILVLPSAVLQATTYAWIFNALNQTIKDLEDRGQEAKLKLFNSFQNVLVASIGIVAVWLVSGTWLLVVCGVARISRCVRFCTSFLTIALLCGGLSFLLFLCLPLPLFAFWPRKKYWGKKNHSDIDSYDWIH